MQILERQLETTKFEDIGIDSSWNLEDKKESKMHRIHSYPAKFPAFITRKALEYVSSKNYEVNTIADIFCGCGTTAYEALRNDKNFWGCDINPVATLIAKVKSESYIIDTLNRYFTRIQLQADSKMISKKEINGVNERIHYWFETEQIRELLKIKSAIHEVTPDRGKYRKFFLCAFSNILKITSRWLQKSIKPTIDPNKKTVNVRESFKTQFEMMKQACQENQENIRRKRVKQIETFNIVNRRIKKPKADLLVTSPPYVTSYEYADLHQMSALWLDFTDDFRELRRGR